MERAEKEIFGIKQSTKTKNSREKASIFWFVEWRRFRFINARGDEAKETLLLQPIYYFY